MDDFNKVIFIFNENYLWKALLNKKKINHEALTVILYTLGEASL